MREFLFQHFDACVALLLCLFRVTSPSHEILQIAGSHCGQARSLRIMRVMGPLLVVFGVARFFF